MKLQKLLTIIISASLLTASCDSRKDVIALADYVNPFIGASTSTAAAGVYHGLGKTFPGADTPFGMVQVSPQTITGGDNGSGYSDEHRTIEGFSFTQMSGVGGYGDLGNLMTMPTTGKLQKIAGLEDGSIGGWRSRYDKESETAKAGYYSVHLTDYDISVECTATKRCGALRFTFPESDTSRIQIDLARRVAGSAEREYIKVVDDHTITGWMKCTPETGGFGNGEFNALYTVYFYATFDTPVKDYGFWMTDIPDGWARKKDEVVSLPYLQYVAEAPVYEGVDEMEGDHVGFFMNFPTEKGQQVVMKVGISFVDLDGARNNYMKEIDEKDFDEIRADAFDAWNKQLSKVMVTGGTEDDKTIFYTAMYHASIDPRIYTDVDGRYVGGDYNIHKIDGSFTKRTIFSGWDVFRSEMPLLTMTDPGIVSDIMNSLITMADQSGRHYLSRWEMLNAYTGTMIGNPAIAVMADTYAKGIRTYDVQKGYEYAKNSSAKFGNGDLGWHTSPSIGISETLEYAYFDWCLSELARMLGKHEDAALYAEKGQAYRNIYDKEHGWFRPRNADGSWVEWPDSARIVEGYGCIESNPYQQGWFVPHDVDGMVELMGGKEHVLADLNYFFEMTPQDFHWNHYYNHANEPVHHVPFLFNVLGEPWNTQKWTRIICQNAYQNQVAGLVGNDDCGQMSAWYILAASGIHPLCPGSTRMEITSPVFDTITFTLDPEYASGKEFKVIAHDNSNENMYIQRAKLNGKELTASHIDFSDISSGGVLELYMGPEPNREWGIE